MGCADNEKREKTNNGINSTAKWRRNKNTSRKGKLQVLWNIESRPHQTSDKIKNKKRVSKTNEKA